MICIRKKRLERSMEVQKQQAEKLEDVQKLIIKQSMKNSRGAGRKPVLNENNIDKVRILYEILRIIENMNEIPEIGEKWWQQMATLYGNDIYILK